MNDLFKSTLQELTAAGPIDLAADWKELRKLEALSEKATLTDRNSAFEAILSPALCINGLTLHRLSIGAEAFLVRIAKWFKDGDAAQDVAAAYVLAHARTPETHLWPLADDEDAFRETINEWKKGLRLTSAELCRMIDFFQSVELAEVEASEKKEGDSESGILDHGPLIEVLTREYGQTPRYWLWEATASEVKSLLDSREIASAKDERAAKQANPKIQTNPDRRDVVANFKFMQAARKLRDTIAGRVKA